MVKLLREQGPKLSNELIKIIIEQNNLKPEAARKRLSRLKLPITKIKGLFTNNQALYHLQEQYKKPIFYNALI